MRYELGKQQVMIVRASPKFCESNASLYDPIMPGAFNKQAEKFRSNGLPSTYNILVIESENQILGFLGTIECNEKSLYLVAIYLHQSHQRSGIGSIILEELVRNYRSAGYDEIVLLVHKEAVWAKSFYLKNQFKYVSSSELDIKSYGNGILSNLYIPKYGVIEP